MNQKRYWLRFGISFLILDVILSFALAGGIFGDSLSPWGIYLAVAINPYMVLDISRINFLRHFPLTSNGIYFWSIVWFIIGALVGGLYGKIRK